MELTLGPIYYNWKREDILRFYEEVCGWPVERVYLGEVVCSMKRELSPGDLEEIGERLIESGKEVVLSGLALVSNEDDLESLRALFKLPFPLEANDISLFNMNGDREVIAGPHIATYNTPSMDFLKGLGVKRVTFPVELSKDSIKHILSKSDIEGEVMAFGKVPLTFSWRCYTLRHLGLTRKDCRNNCRRYPEGIPVDTVDGKLVFTINGTQVLSGPVYSLFRYIDELREIGVRALRVSPEYKITGDVLKLFRDRMEGDISQKEGLDRLEEITNSPFCNGWYEGREGIKLIED